ncbi:GNAT family N-acetyltransferase [Virgibacillus sp. DJP39]|uniref:GNAT family N-acetyltransferase n=1 Tax=Virgibacillus sp. DJP39 TaxID=3409790 RepID=UPI003BB7E3DD
MLNEDIFTKVPTLETKHYILRGLTVDDSSLLFTFMCDREKMKFIAPHPVQTVKEMEDKVRRQLYAYRSQKEIPWVIINKDNGDVVGQFRLHKLNMWHKKAETGVVIRKEYQKRGVMTEIFGKVLEYSFETLGLNRIVGDIFAGNQGSEKLLKKYGFTKEGVLRQTDFDGNKFHDTAVYSLMKSEYNSLL